MTIECPMHYGSKFSSRALADDMAGRNYMDSPLIRLLTDRLDAALRMIECLESEVNEGDEAISAMKRVLRTTNESVAILKAQVSRLSAELLFQ